MAVLLTRRNSLVVSEHKITKVNKNYSYQIEGAIKNRQSRDTGN